MGKSSNYLAPGINFISCKEQDVIMASQVDVYTPDGFNDGWTDNSILGK